MDVINYDCIYIFIQRCQLISQKMKSVCGKNYMFVVTTIQAHNYFCSVFPFSTISSASAASRGNNMVRYVSVKCVFQNDVYSLYIQFTSEII